MNKPFIKDLILLGIPTLISVLGALTGIKYFSDYQIIIIISIILLLIAFIASVRYYSKQENKLKSENEELKTTISSMNKILGINSKTVVSTVNLLENWNNNINKIANDILKNGYANEKDWDYEKIYTDICISCKNSITSFTGINEETDLSVSFIKYYNSNNNDCVKMIAHSSPQTARPDVFDKEEPIKECNYQYARMIRNGKRDIFVLENNQRIQQVFYKKTSETNLSKYSQYIAIPVICSRNKYLGVLQITTKHDYKIMDTEIELQKFSETYITPFAELLVLVEKIGKGIFVKPTK